MSYVKRLNRESQILVNDANRRLQKEKRERRQLDLKRLLYQDLYDNYKPTNKTMVEQFHNKIEQRTKLLLEQNLIVQLGTETLITEQGVERLVKYALKLVKKRYDLV